MEYFAQLLVNGIAVGAVYGMVGVGLSLIFGILEVVNFAQGEFYMVGAYVAWYVVSQLGAPYAVGILAAAAAVGLLGVLVQVVGIRPVAERGWMLPIVATLGVGYVLQTVAIATLTSNPRTYSTALALKSVDILGVTVNLQRVLVVGVAVALFVALHLFVQKTRIGKAMRAVSQNKDASRVLGLPIEKIGLLAFGVSGMLTGVAGAIVSPIASVFPQMGAIVTLKAFAVVILGGFGNIKGAIVAAFIIGVGESFWAGYGSYQYRDIIAFLILITILLVKPQGLFGKKAGI